MKIPISKILLTTVAFIIVAGGFFIAKGILSPKLYYPYLSIVGPEDIQIKVLQRGQVLSSQCVRSLASQETAIRATCPSCKIEVSLCQTGLDSAKQVWLSDDPLTIPSARMAYGVFVFEAPDQKVALATCQESERVSLGNALAARLVCFPPGMNRPLLAIEQVIVAQEQHDRRHAALVIFGSVIGLIVLIIVARALVQRFAMREPEMGEFSEAISDRVVVFKFSNYVKRGLDIFLAIVLLLIFLIPLFFIFLLVNILEGSPVFYMSRRFISFDTSVTIFKFRTMVRDATSPKYQLKERFMRDGYLDIPLTCEVYTPIGRFLERSQLVETLQLFNILAGDMSFVGNRPLPQDNIDLLKQFPGWEGRFDSPTGITGIAQIAGKYGLKPRQRLNLERMYASIYRSRGGNILLCDLYIIVHTVWLLLTGQYLGYGKAVDLLTRFGADKNLQDYMTIAAPTPESDHA